MTVTLTERNIEAIKPGKLVYDGVIDGLAVKAYPSGKRSFVFEATINGKRRRVVIGSHPAWSLTAAREQAATYRRIVDQGGDPFAVPERKYTLNDVWARYERDYLPKLGKDSGKDIRAKWNAYILPALGDKPVDAIDFSDVERVHRSIAAPYAANRTYETLRRILNLAIQWGLIDKNPARGLVLNRETPKSTYLTEGEIRSIIAQLPTTASGDLIRILFLTGARVGEVRSMCWKHLDIDRGIWTKPESLTKQRRVHTVPLGGAALAIIKRQPQRSDLVFTREDGGRVADVRKTWLWSFKRAGVELVRIHDARHSYASVLASGGASLPMVGAMLGHSSPSITNRYAHVYSDPLREAADKVGSKVG